MFDKLSKFYFDAQNQKKDRWDFAHQIEANSTAKIAATLSAPENWTPRNILNYRYLGLISKSKSSVSITDVGELFLDSDWTVRQSLIDEQLLKMWLKNPTNNRKKIDVFPLPTLALICSKVGTLAFHEFYLTVIWVNKDTDVDKCVELIFDLRKLSQERLAEIKRKAVAITGNKDLAGSSRRIFGMLQLHSAFRKSHSMNGEPQISLIGSPAEADKYFGRAILELNSKDSSKYVEWLEEPFSMALPRYINEDAVIKESSRGTDVIDSTLVYKELLLSPTANSTGSRRNKSIRQKIDFEAKNKVTAQAGNKSEEIVLAREIRALSLAGKKDLAQSVKRVSLESESYGFDILSFDLDGNERHLEVKGIKQFSNENRIFMTSNEIETASLDVHYELVLVFNYDDPRPKIFSGSQLLDAVRVHKLRSSAGQGTISLRTQSLEIVFSPHTSNDLESVP